MIYKSKWFKIGISKKERNKTYSKLRLRANTILKHKHRKEYLKILKKLIKKEIRIIKLLKGGKITQNENKRTGYFRAGI